MFFCVLTDKNIGTLFMWLIATTPDDFKAEKVDLWRRKKTNPKKLTLTLLIFYSKASIRNYKTNPFRCIQSLYLLPEILISQKGFVLAV